MIHLKNKPLLQSILAVLILFLSWFETGEFQFSLFLFVITLTIGWAFTLPAIKNRFDEVFFQQINWIIPTVASVFLAASSGWLNQLMLL